MRNVAELVTVLCGGISAGRDGEVTGWRDHWRVDIGQRYSISRCLNCWFVAAHAFCSLFSYLGCSGFVLESLNFLSWTRELMRLSILRTVKCQ
jgi:hypothetical protein